MADHQMTAHITQYRIEDARFMIDNGASPEEAARRLGMEIDALKKLLERHR